VNYNYYYMHRNLFDWCGRRTHLKLKTNVHVLQQV